MIRRRALHWTLGGQLLLTLTGVAIISLALIVAVVVWQTRAILTAQTGDAFIALAVSESQRLQEELSREVNTLQNMAIGETFYTWLISTSETDMVGLSSDERAAHFQARETAWVDGTDQVLRASVLFNSISKELNDFVLDFPGHTQLLLTDRYGRLMAAGGDTPEHYYYGDQTWWRAAWNDGEGGIYVGSLPLTIDGEGAMIEIAVPVKFGFAVRGVLHSQFAIDELNIFSNAPSHIISLGKTGELTLVNDTGLLLYSSNPARVGKQLPEGMRDDLNSTPSGWDTHPAEAGQRIIYSHAALTPGSEHPYLDTLRWSIMVQQNEAEALASVRRLTQLACLSGLLALGLSIVVGGWTARRLARPIRDLTNTASTMAGGELGVMARISGPLELRTLAESFNSMTTQLRTLVEGLEQRVAERTHDLERRTRYLQATAEVAHSASSVLDPAQLLSRSVTLISEQFGFYHTGIFLLDSSGEWAVLQAASSEGGQRMLARGHRLRVGQQGIVGYTTGRGEPHIVSDVRADSVYFDNPDLLETRSEMALPLRAQGEIIGALDVQSTEPDAFGQEDVAVLQTLADQVAMAISNARLFQQAQESLAAERRAYSLLSRRAWQEALGARPTPGYRYDQNGVTPLNGHPYAYQPAERLPELTLSVKVRGQVIGTVNAHKPKDTDQWTEEEVALMETLTDQLGMALESARLYEDTQRRAAREELTSQVTARMRETLDMDTVLQTALREIGERLDIAEAEVRIGGI
jgi:GAF domain-containing protein